MKCRAHVFLLPSCPHDSNFEPARALNRERPKAPPVQSTGCYPVITTHAKKTKRTTRTWICTVRIAIRPAQPSAMGSQGMLSRGIQEWYRGYLGVVSWGIRGWYPGVSKGIRGIRSPSGALLSPKMTQITMAPVTRKGILGGGSKCYIILEGAQQHFGATWRTSTCSIVCTRAALVSSPPRPVHSTISHSSF